MWSDSQGTLDCSQLTEEIHLELSQPSSKSSQSLIKQQLNQAKIEQKKLVTSLKSSNAKSSLKTIKLAHQNVQDRLAKLNKMISNEHNNIVKEGNSQLNSTNDNSSNDGKMVKAAQNVVQLKKFLIALVKIHKQCGAKIAYLEKKSSTGNISLLKSNSNTTTQTALPNITIPGGHSSQLSQRNSDRNLAKSKNMFDDDDKTDDTQQTQNLIQSLMMGFSKKQTAIPRKNEDKIMSQQNDVLNTSLQSPKSTIPFCSSPISNEDSHSVLLPSAIKKENIEQLNMFDDEKSFNKPKVIMQPIITPNTAQQQVIGDIPGIQMTNCISNNAKSEVTLQEKNVKALNCHPSKNPINPVCVYDSPAGLNHALPNVQNVYNKIAAKSKIQSQNTLHSQSILSSQNTQRLDDIIVQPKIIPGMGIVKKNIESITNIDKKKNRKHSVDSDIICGDDNFIPSTLSEKPKSVHIDIKRLLELKPGKNVLRIKGRGAPKIASIGSDGSIYSSTQNFKSLEEWIFSIGKVEILDEAILKKVEYMGTTFWKLMGNSKSHIVPDKNVQKCPDSIDPISVQNDSSTTITLNQTMPNIHHNVVKKIAVKNKIQSQNTLYSQSILSENTQITDDIVAHQTTVSDPNVKTNLMKNNIESITDVPQKKKNSKHPTKKSLAEDSSTKNIVVYSVNEFADLGGVLPKTFWDTEGFGSVKIDDTFLKLIGFD